jgi:hypothetical protein
MSNINLDTKQNTQNALGTSLKDECCLMSLPEISCPTGKKTVKKKEVILLDDSSVCSDKISGGQLDWYPQDKLTEFQTLRKQAYGLFEENAIQVNKMYLVSLASLDAILSKLDDIREKWEQLIEVRKASFAADIDAYKLENPAIAKLVDLYQLVDSDFFSVFQFRYNPPLAFQPLFPQQEEELAELARESLLKEIASEAGRQYKTSFTKGENVSQKAITALHRIRTKLVNMSFLEDVVSFNGVSFIVDTFDNVMRQLPKTGKIEGPLYHKLGHFVSQLANVENLSLAVNGEDGINVSAFFEQPDIEDDLEDILEIESPVQNTAQDFECIFEDNIPFEDSFTEDSDTSTSSAQPAQSEMDWMDF